MSSIVTPTDTVPPAVIDDAGWVVMASLFSPAGFTVIFRELICAAVGARPNGPVRLYVPEKPP